MNIRTYLLVIIGLVVPIIIPSRLIGDLNNAILFIGLAVVYSVLLLQSKISLISISIEVSFVFGVTALMVLLLLISSMSGGISISVLWAFLKIIIWFFLIYLSYRYSKFNWNTFLPISMRVLKALIVFYSFFLYLSLIQSDISLIFANYYGLSFDDVERMHQYYHNRPSVFFGNPNFLGIFCALSLIILMVSEQHKSKLDVFMISLLSINIALSRSRTALVIVLLFLALNIIHGFMFGNKRRATVQGLFFATSFIAFLFWTGFDSFKVRYLSNLNLAGRDEIWGAFFSNLGGLSLFIGSFGSSNDAPVLDNDFIFVLYFTGVIGLFLLISLYANLIISFRIRKEVLFFVSAIGTAGLASSLISTTKVFLPVIVLLTISFCLANKRLSSN